MKLSSGTRCAFCCISAKSRCKKCIHSTIHYIVLFVFLVKMRRKPIIIRLRRCFLYRQAIPIRNSLDLLSVMPICPHIICLSYGTNDIEKRKNLQKKKKKGNYLLSARLSAACAAIKAAVAKDLKGTGVAFFCPMRCI